MPAVSASALSDEQLMLRCRGAETEVARAIVGELARRHLERLAGFLFGLTGDRAGALDLAQEAFVRVFRHRDRYKEIARFSTWLYTIGRNLALNEIRNRKKRPDSVGSLMGNSGNDSGESDPLSRFAGGDPSPHQAVESSELQVLVRRAIETLPEHYRAPVILCDMEERPYAEAAEILGVPIGTIRSRLSRARAQLERALRPQLSGYVPQDVEGAS